MEGHPLIKRTLTTLIATVVILVATPGIAQAAEAPTVHPEVAYALAAEPGGIATSYTTAEWPDTGATLTVSRGFTTFAVGSCPTGYICAYSGASQSATRLQWSTCGSKSTAALPTVGSIANARSAGTLQARQGATLRASAGAGSYANVPVNYRYDITNVYC